MLEDTCQETQLFTFCGIQTETLIWSLSLLHNT